MSPCARLYDHDSGSTYVERIITENPLGQLDGLSFTLGLFDCEQFLLDKFIV